MRRNSLIIFLIIFSIFFISCGNNIQKEKETIAKKTHIQDSIARAWVDKKIADSIASHK